MKTKSTHIIACVLLLLITITTNAQNWLITGNSGTNPTTNFLGTTDSKAFALRTNNAERMRISSQGNVGIGINSPVAKLQINGGKAVQYSGGGYMIIGNTNKGYMALDTNTIQARANSSFSTLYLNPFGGTTYIGSGNLSTSDGAVVKGINTGLIAYGVDGTGVYGGGNSGYYGGYFYNPDGTAIYGYAGGQEQAIIGYQNFSGDAIYGVATSGGTGVYGFSAHGYGVYGISGDVNSYAGYFDGNLYTTGTFQGSDEKLKQNIHDVSSAMDVIKQLHPKLYQYRQDGNYKLMHLPQGNHYGLIAQDVEKILPDLVKDTKFDIDKAITPKLPTYDPKHPGTKTNFQLHTTNEIINFKALNYTELIPIIIRGMQEQQQTIDDLKQINQQQQEQINQLKNLIETRLNNTDVSSIQTTLNSAALLQNVPNPSKNSTTIAYNLPAKFSSAHVVITGNTGTVLKRINISGAGKGSVNINTSSFIIRHL